MSSELSEIRNLIVDLQKEIQSLGERLGQSTKPILTVEEVAALTGRCEYTIRRWIKEGRLPAERVMGGPNGRLLIRRESLDGLIVMARGESLPGTLQRNPDGNVPCGGRT
jgi:excisionase family DNA binding protein